MRKGKKQIRSVTVKIGSKKGGIVFWTKKIREIKGFFLFSEILYAGMCTQWSVYVVSVGGREGGGGRKWKYDGKGEKRALSLH